MRQQILADEGFERFRKPTRRDQFLAEMEEIIPWRDLCKVIKPFYQRWPRLFERKRQKKHVLA